MRKRIWLWLLPIPLLLAAMFEPYEYIRHGTEPLAVRHNAHAAAERLLTRWGHDSRHILSAGALFPLPPTDTLLILSEQRGMISGDRAAALHDWVRNGGQLVVTARPLPQGYVEESVEENVARWRDHDPLLFALGLTAHRTDAPRPGPETPDFIAQYLDAATLFEQFCVNASAELREKCIGALCRHNDPMVDSHLAGPAGDRRLGLYPGLAFRHVQLGDAEAPRPEEPLAAGLSWHADNDWGVPMARFRLGEGRLTVLSSLDIWNNQQLHLLDHAWLLQWLSDGAGPVWFVRNMDMPPLGRWLWHHAWPLILGGLALLAFYLWRRMPRTGPILATGTEGERDFLDHLTAAGRYLWRTDNQPALLEPLRQEVRRRMHRHPLPAGGHYRYLATHAGLTEEQITRALDTAPDSREDLVAMVATLQTLRSRL